LRHSVVYASGRDVHRSSICFSGGCVTRSQSLHIQIVAGYSCATSHEFLGKQSTVGAVMVEVQKDVSMSNDSLLISPTASITMHSPSCSFPSVCYCSYKGF